MVHRISPVDADTAKALHEKYEESISQVMGMTREEFHAHLRDAFSEVEDEEADPEAYETADNVHPDDMFQDDMFGFDDLFEEDLFDEYESEMHRQAQDAHERDLSAQLMDKDWIKTLFRRTAQILHPDREPDSEKRRLKEQRLSELLLARKENDLLTMLEIHAEATDSQQIELAEKEVSAICDLLEDQIDDLKLQQHAYIYSSPERVMVYQLLYHKNRKKRQQALKLWQQELAQESEQNRHLLAYLRNLKNLKEVLVERRNQRHELFDYVLDDVIF